MVATHRNTVAKPKQVVVRVFHIQHLGFSGFPALNVLLIIEPNGLHLPHRHLVYPAQKRRLSLAVHLNRRNSGFINFHNGLVFTLTLIHHHVVILQKLVGKIHHLLLRYAGQPVVQTCLLRVRTSTRQNERFQQLISPSVVVLKVFNLAFFIIIHNGTHNGRVEVTAFEFRYFAQ